MTKLIPEALGALSATPSTLRWSASCSTKVMTNIPIPQWNAVLHFSSEELSIVEISGIENDYRIRDGHVELRVIGPAYHDMQWHRVPPEAVLQHLELQTPVASWLQNRVGCSQLAS